jgi:RNA ligase (TIGR02306 family)
MELNENQILLPLIEGLDLTELLGILKWEAPISAQLAGIAKGNFPTAVPKTDQERIQNLTRAFEQWKEKDMVAEVTEKLEGSSCTMYLPLAEEDPFEVCSRNLSLKPSETNTFWQVALRYDVETKMRDAGLTGLAIQGELCGPGIQGNPYLLKEAEFYVYDIYDVKRGDYLHPDERQVVVATLGLKHVPVIMEALKLKPTDTIAWLLQYAEGPSQLNHKQEREGLVFKYNSTPTISFKVISNNYLLSSKN